MASTMPKPVKQLGQLLQEQQEPFILEVYLLERGYPKKSLNLKESSGNSTKSSLKNKKGIPQILKAVFNKLGVKHYHHGDRKHSDTEKGRRKNTKDDVEMDRFSSASSTTMINSCFGSDTEEDTFQAQKQSDLRRKEVDTDRKLQYNTMQENKQFSPVSVLEDLSPDQELVLFNETVLFPQAKQRQDDNTSTSRKKASLFDKTSQQEYISTSNFYLRKKVTEGSILSASIWELLLHSPAGIAEQQDLAESNTYIKIKRVLQQSKQLMFDCVREAVETHGMKKRRQQQLPTSMGAEELGKLICEKIRAWGKQYGDETSITQLLDFDFLASAEEWSKLEPETKEIAIQIGDVIFQEILEETVTEMIDIFCTE